MTNSYLNSNIMYDSRTRATIWENNQVSIVCDGLAIEMNRKGDRFVVYDNWYNNQLMHNRYVLPKDVAIEWFLSFREALLLVEDQFYEFAAREIGSIDKMATNKFYEEPQNYVKCIALNLTKSAFNRKIREVLNAKRYIA